MSSSRRFVAGLLTGALAFALVLFVPVVLVDPTTYVGSRWPGKPQLCAPGIRVEARVGKPLALAALRPQEVLLGNSRVDGGFGERMTLQQINRSVMNLGIPGASLEELEVLLGDALEGGQLRRIWLGIDYGMFDQDRQQLLQARKRSSFEKLSTAVTNPDAIGTSYATLIGGGCKITSTTARGFAGPNQYTEPARVLGWNRTLSLSRIKMERTFETIAHSDPRKRAALRHSRRETLERMIQRAHRSGVTVVLFAGPMSRQHFDAILNAGLEDDFTQWRNELQAFGEKKRVPVFDFSDYAVTRELDLSACNPAHDTGCTMYDVSHYHPIVGAYMLKVMRQSLGESRSPLSALN